MVLRRVREGTLGSEDVLLEGHRNEELPDDKVYVDPTSGRVYDDTRGHKLAQLPPDVIEIPKTHWAGYEMDSDDFYPGDKWYNSYSGVKRLNMERMQMMRNSEFRLCKEPNSRLSWRGQLVSHGRLHRNVILEYSDDHPYGEMTVYVLAPQLEKTTHHVYSDGHICYQFCEWNASWTALTVLLTTMRFLDSYYTGIMQVEA